jgi:hypothetical protein
MENIDKLRNKPLKYLDIYIEEITNLYKSINFHSISISFFKEVKEIKIISKKIELFIDSLLMEI